MSLSAPRKIPSHDWWDLASSISKITSVGAMLAIILDDIKTRKMWIYCVFPLKKLSHDVQMTRCLAVEKEKRSTSCSPQIFDISIYIKPGMRLKMNRGPRSWLDRRKLHYSTSNQSFSCIKKERPEFYAFLFVQSKNLEIKLEDSHDLQVQNFWALQDMCGFVSNSIFAPASSQENMRQCEPSTIRSKEYITFS